MELTPQKAKSLTVAKLREELTERGLASDGLKAVLVERLVSHIQSEAETKGPEREEESAQPAEAVAEADVGNGEPAEPEAEAAPETEAQPAAEPETETVTPAAEEPEAEAAAAEPEAEAAAAEPEAEAAAEKPEAEAAAAEPEAEAAAGEAEAEAAAGEPEAEAAPAEPEPEADAAAAAGEKPEEAVKEEEPAKPAEEGDAAEPADADAAATAGDEGDEPPTKKAKTANGASAAKKDAPKPKVSGDPSGKEIFIDNLPPSATEETVKKVAEEQGGEVVSLRVMMTKDEEPKCAGLALVRFQNRDHAARALERLPETKMESNKLEARPSSNANTLFIGNLNKTWTK
ncbi:unnamed protein product, partial [Ectocarpus sp. 12 AP-2014]